MKLPAAILGVLLAVWVGLGTWICLAAPYASGTDESIRYVAFAAATNRWARPSDLAEHGVDHYYYPPLYYLVFAPFFGDEPSFHDRYPRGWAEDPRYRLGGGRQLFSTKFARAVPAELLRLYRAAKLFSLALGAGVLVCLAATLWLLFDGPERPWLVLGGTAPVLLLPQFLYYQTLVNNDALVNFLGALAILCFVAAARRASRGDARGVRRYGIACAAAVGLGLLTKQTAVALLPLLVGLALLSRPAPGAGARARAGAFAGSLAGFAAVAFACGGWWLLRLGLAGDASGIGSLVSAHPWDAKGEPPSLAFLLNVLDRAARSYVALFAGPLYGIPDRVYALYLAVAAALGAALLASRASPRAAWPPPLRLAWVVLAATAAANLGLLLLFNLRVYAPLGRLLFVSLVATHALFALALRRIGRGSERRLAGVVCALTAVLAGLFLWTFVNRVSAAVAPAPERLAPLGRFEAPPQGNIGPVWEVTVEQSVLIPPGTLTGVRLQIIRTSTLPQLGGELRAELRVAGPDGEVRKAAFLPASLGDNDAADRWTDLVLAQPLEVAEPVRAVLKVWGSRPWFAPPGSDGYYVVVPRAGAPALGPLAVDGRRVDGRIAVTAVYR